MDPHVNTLYITTKLVSPQISPPTVCRWGDAETSKPANLSQWVPVPGDDDRRAMTKENEELLLTWAALFWAARLDCDNSRFALRPSLEASSGSWPTSPWAAMPAAEVPGIGPASSEGGEMALCMLSGAAKVLA